MENTAGHPAGRHGREADPTSRPRTASCVSPLGLCHAPPEPQSPRRQAHVPHGSGGWEVLAGRQPPSHGVLAKERGPGGWGDGGDGGGGVSLGSLFLFL